MQGTGGGRRPVGQAPHRAHGPAGEPGHPFACRHHRPGPGADAVPSGGGPSLESRVVPAPSLPAVRRPGARGGAVAAGLVTAVVGFSSAFAVVLDGLRAVGATPAQAASGLMAVTVVMGVATIVLAVRTRMPVTVAWSTPGAALLASTGAAAGGLARGRRRLRRRRCPARRGRPRPAAGDGGPADPGPARAGDARRRAAAAVPAARDGGGRRAGARRAGRAHLAGRAAPRPAVGGAGRHRGRGRARAGRARRARRSTAPASRPRRPGRRRPSGGRRSCRSPCRCSW